MADLTLPPGTERQAALKMGHEHRDGDLAEMVVAQVQLKDGIMFLSVGGFSKRERMALDISNRQSVFDPKMAVKHADMLRKELADTPDPSLKQSEPPTA